MCDYPYQLQHLPFPSFQCLFLIVYKIGFWIALHFVQFIPLLFNVYILTRLVYLFLLQFTWLIETNFSFLHFISTAVILYNDFFLVATLLTDESERIRMSIHPTTHLPSSFLDQRRVKIPEKIQGSTIHFIFTSWIMRGVKKKVRFLSPLWICPYSALERKRDRKREWSNSTRRQFLLFKPLLPSLLLIASFALASRVLNIKKRKNWLWKTSVSFPSLIVEIRTVR